MGLWYSDRRGRRQSCRGGGPRLELQGEVAMWVPELKGKGPLRLGQSLAASRCQASLLPELKGRGSHRSHLIGDWERLLPPATRADLGRIAFTSPSKGLRWCPGRILAALHRLASCCRS
jgi:hypothetical protein